MLRSFRRLALLPLFLLGSCTWNYAPQHAKVDAASLQKLASLVRDPVPLGYQVRDGNIRFAVEVDSPDVVTVPMVSRSGLPSIPVRINGADPIPMILDTGAQRTVLDARTAISRRVALLDPGLGGPTLAGSLGSEDGYLGLLTPIQLGSFHMARYIGLVRTHHNAIRHFGELKRTQVALDIFGMDLPKRLFSYLTLDYPGARARLGVRGDFRPEPGSRVWRRPLIWRDDLPHVKMRAGGVEWIAMMDSGFSEALEISESVARELGVYDSRVQVSGGYQIAIGGSQTAADSLLGVAVMPKIEGAGPDTVRVPALITQGRPKIGSGFMKNFTVTLDFKHGQVWFEDRIRQ